MKALAYYRGYFAVVQLGALQCPLRTLPFYIVTYWLAFEGLNAQAAYLNQKNYRYINLFLLVLPAFVVLVRNHWVPFYAPGMHVYNIVEHLLFAFTLCLLLDSLLGCWRKTKHAALGIVFALNAIGWVNECFQNACVGEPLFDFSAEDWKDLGINFIGSILFYGVKHLLKSMKNND